MTFAHVLAFLSIPFLITTIIFGIYRGENFYYDSDDYDGNGTSH
jgi:hypothetical protein